MTSSPPSSLESSVIVLAILVLFVARRTFFAIRGARYSVGRLFAFAAFALLLLSLFAATTLYAAFGAWGWVALALVVPYGATVAVTAVLTEPHVRRDVRFEERPDGRVYYRLSWLVPVVYFVLFTARIVVEVVVLGISSFGSVSFPSTLPTPILLTSIAFDLLYAVSVGLLLGRAFGVRRAYPEARPPPGTAPVPNGSKPLP